MWQQDFDTLKHDVHTLFLRRQTFEELDRALVKDGTESATYLCEDFLRPLYVEGQAMTIRRLADPNTRTVSFDRLLNDMEQRSWVLSRQRHIDRYMTIGERQRDLERSLRYANIDFDGLAGVGEPYVPPARIHATRSRLHESASAVKAHVDQHVAHRDRERGDPTTWGKLHHAVDELGRLLMTISVLLTGASLYPDPTFQFDWKDVLRRGLFKRPLEDWDEWEILFSESFT